MTDFSRRSFLRQASAAAVVGTIALKAPRLLANPLGLPLGLQLYSVRDLLPKDYEGTLHKLGELGYQEVEAAGFFGHDPNQVNAAMKNAGLKCVSAHYGYDALNPKLDEILDFGHKIGLSYLICAFPGHKDPSQVKSGHGREFSLDDWRWNAEQFNRIGEKAHAAGIRFGYHNHTMEFRKQEGVVPLDEVIKLTDPAKVTFELDCGWVMVGGADPVTYLKKYASRISMLHVKDFKELPKAGSESTPPPAANLGQGAIDYKPIFAAADKSRIKHMFVEQEQFDMPPYDALKVDATYMQAWKG